MNYHFKRKLKNTKAFTLIELIIALSIIVLLSAVVIPNYWQYVRKNDLKMAMEEIKAKVLYTQSLALAQQPDENTLRPYTYYRFIFYPDSGSKGIEYEIRAGNYEFSSNPAPPGSVLETLPIEKGLLPSTIKYEASEGEEITNITINDPDATTNKRQGYIVFQTVSGKCNHWHTQEPITYTFKNNVTNEAAKLSVNVKSCKVDINYLGYQ